MPSHFPHRALVYGVAGVAAAVLTLLIVGVVAAENKGAYELVKDLFVPLVSPLVAVLIPVTVLFLIPQSQSRQKLALDLCAQYFAEEMRDARNVAWHHFVTEQQQLPPVRRAERLVEFLDYHTSHDFHRSITPELDETFQKSARVLDFFALVNGCVKRGVADGDIVKDFLLFYYLWWRDEIMDPLRRTRRMLTDHPKVRPTWWTPLAHLDALAGPGGALPARRAGEP